MSEKRFHRYTCVGMRRLHKRGKYYMSYLDREGVQRAWSKSLGSTIGGMYDAEIGDSPATVFVNTAKFVGMDPTVTTPQLNEWRLLDRAARVEQEAVRAENRLRKENTDFGDLTLREVKGMMHKQLHTQRQAMILAVNGYLTGGR